MATFQAQNINIFEGNKKISTKWIALFLIISILGVYGVANILIHGHEEALGVTRSVPWGIFISTYEFFVVSSIGLFLISSMGFVFGIEKYKPIAKRGVVCAILTLICGFGVMGAETAHPIRMLIYNVLTPNFHSSIWWMGTFYGMYLLSLFIVLYFLMKNNLKSAFYAGVIAFLVGLSAQSNLGAVFALLEARPFWHGPYLPIYFILSALISGCALTIVIFNVAYRNIFDMPAKYKDALLGISKIFGLLVGVLIFFNIWKIRVSLYGAPPEKYEAMMQLLSGQLAFNFWFFEVILGLLLPFVIILVTKGNNIKASLIAAISFIIGAFFMRYDLVIAGQLYPMRAPAPGAGVEGATASGYVTYTPSFTEIAVVIGAIAFCCFLYLTAERVLNLED